MRIGGGLMDEGQARQRIRIAYARLKRSQGAEYNVDAGQFDRTVTYHINAIRNAGGGQWSDIIASDYVGNLESQLEEEIVASDKTSMDEETVSELDEGEITNQRFDRSM